MNCVLQLDIAETVQDYVHRVGRTARAGKRGRAVVFVASDVSGDFFFFNYYFGFFLIFFFNYYFSFCN